MVVKLPRIRLDVPTIIEVAGIGAIAAGCILISLALGLIVLGILLVVAALGIEFVKAKGEE
jgi:hypothetical protein